MTLSLEKFDYKVEHRSAEKLKHANALRRFPIMVCRGHANPFCREEKTRSEKITCRKAIATSRALQRLHYNE